MKKNMKTVTVTRVGHPLPHPTTPGLAPEITVQAFSIKKVSRCRVRR